MRSTTLLILIAGASRAQIPLAISNYPLHSRLAPCAAEAISSRIQAFEQSTQLGCGTAASQLQSCVCSQSQVYRSAESAISAAVENRCGRTAADDQSSASEVLSQYCNPGKTIAFSTPTTASQPARQTYATATVGYDAPWDRVEPTAAGVGDGPDEGNFRTAVASPGVIAGSVVALAVGIVLLVVGTFWFLRHRRDKKARESYVHRQKFSGILDLSGLEGRSNCTSEKVRRWVSSQNMATSEVPDASGAVFTPDLEQQRSRPMGHVRTTRRSTQ